MTINADTLIDRLYLKSQVNKWRILTVVFGVLALLAVVERNSMHSPIEKSFVARVTMDGIIEDDPAVYEMLEDVGNNPKAKAVIVWLDTPGGSAVGGEETYLRLRALAQKKPVVAVMRSVTASAGYMTALGSDYIVAREGTITGSIGALIETAEFTDMAEKLGIKPILVKSGPLKASPNPLEKTSPEALRSIQEVINDFHDRFVDMVAERRHLPRGQVLLLADGRVYSGKRALETKLIDALGGEEEAVAWLETQKNIGKDLEIKDVRPETEDSLLMRLTQSMSGFFLNKSRVSLDGVRAIWHPAF